MQCYPLIHSDDDLECAEAADNLRLVCADDCPAQPLHWLWPNRIPLGKVTLLIGDPGTGKSLVALDIAARASRAGSWPEANNETRTMNAETSDHSSFPTNPQSEIRNPKLPASSHSSFDIRHSLFPASTILLSASDDLADTIRPRLDAAGADPRRVFVIPSIADLRNDFQQFRAAVNRAPNCRLIIIDPINAYVGPSDSHFHTVVRKVLAPLAQLAAENSIAVIAIAHLRKNDGDAIYRAAGSMGFVASARTVWSVSHDPETPGRHLLLPVKNNIGPDAYGLAYAIQPTGPVAAPAIVWDPTPIDRQHVPIKLRGQDAADLHPVRLWLRDELAPGPRAARELLEAAAQLGFHERTVRRALHALGGHTQNRGILDGWWWSLPETNDEARMTNHQAANHSSFDIRHSSFPANPQSAIRNPQSPASPRNIEKAVPSCPLPEILSTPPTTTTSPTPSAPQLSTLIPQPCSVSQSIAALNRLDRQRRNDRRPKGNQRPNPQPDIPVLDAILQEFRKTLPTTNPLHHTPNTS